MNRYHISISRAIVLAVVLVLVLAGGGGAIVPSAHAAPQQPTHTLILRSPGVATNYSIAVSGTITTGPQESGDTVNGQQVSGHIGGATDTQDGDATDFIKYTGYITGFTAKHSGLHATLDGTLLNASLLDANHLQLKTDTSAQGPTRYTVTVNGTIVSGEATEDRDVPTNTTTVSGWLLPGDSDGFYFTGEIVSASSSVSRTANVRVNGQSQSLSSPSTPKPTPTRTTSSNSSTTSTPRSSSTTQQSSHTLVIDQPNGSVGYTVTVSGSLTLTKTEASDDIAGDSVTGRVGGMPWNKTDTDPADVIHFTGEVRNFESGSGTIRVRLDGKRVDPASLHNTPVSTPPETVAHPSPTQSPSSPLSPPPSVDAPDHGESPRGPPSATVTAPSARSAMSDGVGLLSGLGWIEQVVLGFVALLAVAGAGILLAIR